MGKNTSSIYNFTLLFILLSLFIIEPLSYKFTSFGEIGTVLWACLFLFILIEALKKFKGLIFFAFHKKYILTLCAYSILVGVSLLAIILPINSHYEAAQEITCKLSQYSLSGFGYNSTCHFGYPARIFILPSLPSLILGRSLFALNFGGWIYIFCGITIFSSSLIEYFREKRNTDIATSFSIAMLPNFYYFNYFLFAYELGIFPTIFTLIQIGFYLLYLSKGNIRYILLLLAVNYYLIFSYTTGLAVVFLSSFYMFFFIFEKSVPKLHKLLFMLSTVITLLLFISSLFIRNDIHIISASTESIDIFTELNNSFAYFINGHALNPFSTSLLSLTIFVVILALLSFQFGKKYFVAGVWAIGVIIFATISHGYSFNSIDFRIHRSLIIIPIIITFAGIIVHQILLHLPQAKKIIIVIVIFMLSLGLYYQYIYLNSKIGGERHRHFVLIKWLETNFQKEILQSGILLFDTNPSYYISINDNLHYYYPGLNAENIADDCSNTILRQKNIILFTTNIKRHECLSNYINNAQLINTFLFSSDEPLMIYVLK